MRASWPATWRRAGIDALAQPFGDISVIPNAIQLVRAGVDPYTVRPGYPTLNYPRPWIALFSAFGFDRHVIGYELGVIALLLACFSHLILSTQRFGSAICVWLGSLSWVVFLVIERGNTDMVAFVLTYASVLVTFAAPAALLLTLAAVLKLYPGAVFLASPFGRRKPLFWFGLGLLVFLADLLFSWRDLIRIQHNTPHTYLISYGVAALVLRFLPSASALVGGGVLLGAMVGSGVLVGWGVRAGRGQPVLPSEAQRLFLVFGTVFVATFLLTPNFVYRLIFLIPTIPFWWEMRGGGGFPRVATGSLVLVLLSLDSPVLHHLPHFGRVAALVIFLARIVLFPVYSFFLGWVAEILRPRAAGLRG